MRLHDEKKRSLIAGEYVLGLLRGKALRRFERLKANDARLRDEVNFWQQHFCELSQALQLQQPPAHVWENISARLGMSRVVEKPGFRFGLEFWRGFVTAGVLFVLISFVLFNGKTDQAITVGLHDYFAILQDQQSQPILVASINDHQGYLVLEMLKPKAQGSQKDLQVWCIPKTDKEPPMSIGIVNQRGITTFKLSKEEMVMLKDARALAVSIEPKGGSEQPTGPILYTGLSI